MLSKDPEVEHLRLRIGSEIHQRLVTALRVLVTPPTWSNHYTCAARRRLDTEKGWRAAISAYNATDAYLREVARVGVAYNPDAAKAAKATG